MNRLLRLLILIKAEIIQRLLSVVDGTKKSEITSIVSTSLFLSALLSRGLSLSLSLQKSLNQKNSQITLAPSLSLRRLEHHHSQRHLQTDISKYHLEEQEAVGDQNLETKKSRLSHTVDRSLSCSIPLAPSSFPATQTTIK